MKKATSKYKTWFADRRRYLRMTIREAAAAMGVGVTTIKRWDQGGAPKAALLAMQAMKRNTSPNRTE